MLINWVPGGGLGRRRPDSRFRGNDGEVAYMVGRESGSGKDGTRIGKRRWQGANWEAGMTGRKSGSGNDRARIGSGS